MMKDDLRKLKLPAIFLAIFGFISGMFGALILLSGLLRILDRNTERLPSKEGELIGFIMGSVAIYGVAFLSVIAATIIIYSAIQLMNGKRIILVKFASILAMLPITTCCFFFGLPVGIWTLYLLAKPEIKEVFDRSSDNLNHYMPQPNKF